MSNHPPKKLTGLGIVVVLLSVFSLLLGACGDNTATITPPTTTAATTAPATTAAAMTSATATTAGASSAAATTSATSGTLTGEVVIYAAASLTDPFNQIKADLEKANPGLKITYSFGGSNTLRTQLEQGAKADVFASANQTEMDNALKSSLVADKGQVFARNRLVVILPRNNPAKITKLQDLANPGIKIVTAAKDVPVGGYTLTALDKMSKDATFTPDFSTKVQANFVSQESNVKQVVAKVQLGEADAGVCYLTDISASVKNDISTLEIPDQFNTLASYPISALKGASNSAGAAAFVKYILGSKGQDTLKSFGFITSAGSTGSTLNGAL
ncbi:MAG: molybdate ABC transporter substrate-binding protein [Chloroflexi bacterium]|nr:molybdate ABC transporter substrate-binding protein [Chloroflexota bacterium]